MYQVIFRKTALKGLRKLPANVTAKFRSAFDKLAQDPDRRDFDVQPLQGRDGYRLRIQGWRALYTIEHDHLVILVLDLGPRGDIYK